MKKTIRSISLMLITSTIISCTRTVDTPTANTTGNWKVSLYWDKKDETTDFTGWTFEYGGAAQLKATKGTEVVTGQWTIHDGNRFQINFGTHAVLGKLNDDWLIEENTSSSIKLKDDNPTKDERVQFVKL